METSELKLLIEEKEVNINVCGKDDIEISPILSSLLKPINHDYVGNETLFVVVKTYRDDVVKNLPGFVLCGKTMLDWVLLAGVGCEQKIVEDVDVFKTLKNLDTDKKIIAVFYCDTPLLDHNTFLDIMDYFSSKNINYLQLSRGFIVRSDYLKNNDEFMHGSFCEYDDNNLMVVDSAKKINLVHKILQDKIRTFHINNGVVILGEQSVFIDCDVEIEKGTIIYPNNVLKGETILQGNVELKEGNLIVDSIISANSTLTNCFIEKSKVSGDLKNKIIVNQEV